MGMKAVALFMDGTSNTKRGADADGTSEPSSWTNVAILSERIPDDLPPGPAERYLEGVGSDEVGGIAFRKRARNIFGKACGYGLTGKVQTAYERLCRYHLDGFTIFLFGFSRGASAARVLAGFVDEVGLLLKTHLDLVDEAWRIYVRCGDADASDLREYLRRIDDKYQRPSPETGTQLPIYFLGVWDTVAMWMTLDGTMYDPTSRISRVPSNVTHARHALAIHEVRRYFPELPWTSVHPPLTRNESIRQVWFPGNHADVGGGARDHPALAHHALDWMVAEACSVGLPVAAPPSSPDATADMRIVHDESHRNVPRVFETTVIDVRDSLRDWWDFEPVVRLGVSVDEDYIRWLVNDERLAFEDGIPEVTQETMTRAEDAAVRLQMVRRYVHEAQEPPDWIALETRDSAKGCARAVRTFLTAPGRPVTEDTARFIQAVQRWALLESGEVWNEIERIIQETAAGKTPESHEHVDVLQATLSRFASARLAVDEACKPLPPSCRRNPFADASSVIKEMNGKAAYTRELLGLREQVAGTPLKLKVPPPKAP